MRERGPLIFLFGDNMRSRKSLNKASLVFGVIKTDNMGNASADIDVAENVERRELRMANISDTAGRLSIGDGTNLTLTNYTISLAAGATLTFSGPISTQAIYAICGAATKKIAFQEAT